MQSDLDIVEIQKAVEEFYFPAILEDKLQASFSDSNGETYVAAPRERADLDQFVRLWECCIAQEKIESETLKVDCFNRYEGKNLGWYAFEAAEADEAESHRKNSIAISRGWGLVNNYIRYGSDAFEPVVGVFVADADAKNYLLFSENPAHSEWSDSHRRLKELDPDLGPRLVKTLKRRLTTHFSIQSDTLKYFLRRTAAT